MRTLDERRQSKRFGVVEKTAFVINGNWPGTGELVDISKGGFAFHYMSDTPWPDNSADGLMVLGSHDSCLANVPTEVVADRIINSGLGNSMIVRRRCVKFGNLTEQQQFMLECFIWVNATAQC